MAHSNNLGPRRVRLSRPDFVLLGFLVVGGYLLWAEHRAHVLANLPLILILGVCVGMHFFMHGGHGGSHGSNGDESGKDSG